MKTVAVCLLLGDGGTYAFQMQIGYPNECDTIIQTGDIEKDYHSANRIAFGGMTYSAQLVSGTDVGGLCLPRPVPFVTWLEFTSTSGTNSQQNRFYPEKVYLTTEL